MKTLIIAEKPSLAGDIRSLLEKKKGERFSKGRDYSESQNYIISCFFGHLLEMAKPEMYGEKYKNWDFSALPIIPDKYIFNYKNDTEKRGKLLAELAQKCSSVMNACDPDREGEGIFRSWQKHEKIKKPVSRLWAVSLTDDDLLRDLQNTKPAAAYDGLGTAQACRAMADWLVGFNATKAYTCAAGEMLSIGRVRTATLALIVERDLEIENFRPSSTYSINAVWNGINFTYSLDKETKFPEKDRAAALIEKLKDGEYSLKSSETEEKKRNPPKCFSLTELQKTAFESFNFSLDKTLALTQSIYDKKYVTYPRSDSQYLPVSDLEKYRSLALSLCADDHKNLIIAEGHTPPTVKNTDASHTAIIPTGKTPEGLTSEEQQLYDMIAFRFCAAFMQACIYDETKFVIAKDSMAENEFFYARFKNIKDNGFLSAYPENSNNKEQTAELQAIPEGAAPLALCQLKEIPKSKPKHFTPSSLLVAMENCGKKAEGEEKEILNEISGIGTVATQQSYPPELEANGYISIKKNVFVSTEKGRSLIRLLPAELKTPSLTAQWELRLKKIEKGEEGHSGFVADIKALVLRIVEDAKAREQLLKNDISAASSVFSCPKCGKGVKIIKNKEGKHFYSCVAEKEVCGWTGPAVIAGKKITPDVYMQLIEKKKTAVLKNFKKKDGGSFDAALRFDSEFKPEFVFTSGYKCPKCKAETRVFSKGISCVSEREVCGWVLFTEISGKKLSEASVKALMEHGRTNLIKGFKKKDGGTFDAALQFNKDKKAQFVFSKKTNKK